VALTFAVAGVAFGYWVISAVSGSNGAMAIAQTLPTGSTPAATVTPASGQTVTIAFPQASTSGGTAITAYGVSRFLAGAGTGSPAAISGTCSATAGTVTCSDVPGAGTWQYTDTPTYATNWVGTTSAESAAVVVETETTLSNATTPSSVAGVAITPSATLSGATTAPAPTGSITFAVFGPQASPPSSCTGAGWTTVGTPASVIANGSYSASATYTPTAAGTYWWYESYGGDAHNAPSNSGCSLTSTTVRLALSPSALPSITVYVTGYSQTISATDGTAPYSYTVSGGTLPTGLSLSSAGTISGTISAPGQVGTDNFTVTATDHAGLIGTMNYALVVVAPTITLSALANPPGEASYNPSITISPTHGTVAYGYTGSLPTGVSLSSAGVFSGTASRAGTFVFTVTATDGNGYQGARTYSLTPTEPAITIQPASPLTAVATVAYTQTVTAEGGVSQYTYAVTSGALPGTMALSSAGVFSGSSSTAATTSISITATDADGFSGAAAYSLVVVPKIGGLSLGSGTNSCAATLLGPCAASTPISTNTGATEIVVAYFSGTNLSSPGATLSDSGMTAITLLASNPFYSVALSSSGELFAWSAKGNGSGTAEVSVSPGLASVNDVVTFDVVQVSNNSTSTPTGSTGVNSGTTASVTSMLASAPAPGDGSIVVVGAMSASSSFSATSGTSIDTNSSFGVFLVDPSAQTESYTYSAAENWGSIGVELTHG
jgi:hypothetical protein